MAVAPATYSNTLRTPLGSVLTLESDAPERAFGWTTQVKVRSPRGWWAVETGESGAAARQVERELASAFDSEFTYANGTLHLAPAGEAGTFVAWVGPWHDVWTLVPGARPSTTAVVRLLSQLRIEDTVEGVVVRPYKFAGEVMDVHMSTYVPGACAITVHPGRYKATLAPSWSGLRVEGGELWRLSPRSTEGLGSDMLLLATPDVVLTGWVEPEPPHARERTLALISGMQVSLA